MDLRKLSPSQLDALIAKASKRRAALDQGRIERVRRKIDAILKDAGVTLGEVYGTAPARGAKPGPAKPARKFIVKPKFRNPADPSQTWAGRGIKPRWFRDALAAGRTEDELRIAD